ncbi:MAG: phosphotransferase enzyme family protein [Pseudonocardiaceae bacterium]
MTNTAVAFTPSSTQVVLEQACRSVGLNPDGAILARLGENAMYRLRDESVMVRIGRSEQAARKEAQVAEWLASHEFRAVRLTGHGDQPVIANGLPVTFWEFIDEDTQPVASADLGGMLRQLHALPEPTSFQLPNFSPMPKAAERIHRLVEEGLLSSADAEFLRRRHREIAAEFADLEFFLPSGPVHGDAHAGNLMRSVNGTIKMIDFEDFCHGPREWDVAVEAVRHRALDWVSESDYRSYVEEYGFDIIDWPGFHTIRAARELNMTTWLAQRLGQSMEIDTEVRQRISDLRDDQSPRHWRPF